MWGRVVASYFNLGRGTDSEEFQLWGDGGSTCRYFDLGRWSDIYFNFEGWWVKEHTFFTTSSSQFVNNYRFLVLLHLFLNDYSFYMMIYTTVNAPKSTCLLCFYAFIVQKAFCDNEPCHPPGFALNFAQAQLTITDINIYWFTFLNTGPK